MSDLTMAHEVVSGAGRAVQAVARAMPAMVCLGMGGSGSGAVDGALSDLELSVGRVLLGAPAELLSLGTAAVRSAEVLTEADAALAGAVR